jgi:peptidoglycan/xylan/chitin deacetylase (PgdA/CDA1 family)
LPQNRIPVLVIADCEPDPRLVRRDTPASWIGFERFFDYLSDQREAIGARTSAPARFSWFWRMDLQVEIVYGGADWPLRTYARQLAEAERSGDETGLHTHAWRWDEGHGEWVADHGTQSVVEQCVRHSFTAFERALGRPCRVFRFGDGWINEPTLLLLEELGVHIDLTIEPGRLGVPSLVATEHSTGAIPDRREAPTQPYRPSRSDFRQPDRSSTTGLWCFPVSTGRCRQWPLSGERLSWRAWMRAVPTQTLTLNLGFSPQLFGPMFDRAVSSGQRPYAAITVRTDVGSHDGLMSCTRDNLRFILNHRLADRFAFVTPSEGLRMLTE